MADWLAELLSKHSRVAIAGGPRTGKTTLSARITDRPVSHTDDFMKEPWERVPHLVIAMLRDLPAFVVEGVQVPRTLRKGLEVDAVIWLDSPVTDQTSKQRTMSAACRTVFQEWREKNYLRPIYYPPPLSLREAVGLVQPRGVSETTPRPPGITRAPWRAPNRNLGGDK